MSVPQPRARLAKPLDAGAFQPEISSFGPHLAAEGKAGRTIRTYTEAVQWFSAAPLLEDAGRAVWEQVGGQDVQRWMVRFLGLYSGATPATSTARLMPKSSGWSLPRLRPCSGRWAIPRG